MRNIYRHIRAYVNYLLSIIRLFHSLYNIIKTKRKTHFKIATFHNIGSNLLTEAKPFENHV